MEAPFPGQGEPLPSGMAPGVWVAENLIHLSLVELRLTPPPPEWTHAHNISTLQSAPVGSTSAGFSAERLAEGLRIPLNELLEANRRGLLDVEVSRVTCKTAGLIGVRFSFSYGIRCFEVVSCYDPSQWTLPSGGLHDRRGTEVSPTPAMSSPAG
jgi:hypothetical protein